MRGTRLTLKATLTAALFAAAAAFVPGCISSAPAERVGQTGDETALAAIVHHPSADVCGPVAAGFMRCHAKIRMDVTDSTAPQGFGPADLQSAYNLPTSGGAGQTVAVVDAQDDPTAEADLAVYRAQFGLPPCTTANGCFRKVNQSGLQGAYPAADPGWASEISLDLDMVSAACPGCNILLVEADTAATFDLATGVQTAARLGATVISNSWGGAEDPSDPALSSEFFDLPGVLVTASAGDNGYGAQFPASSDLVMAVGGTSLVSRASARGWVDSAWSGTGGGCSSFFAKPSFQTDTGCTGRTMSDVSAVADPDTGVSVYVTFGDAGGWNIFGGTSAASPIVAAVFALVGKSHEGNSFPYENPGAFNDVTSGANGSCDPAYLCNAVVGYDAPTGFGTPDGQAMAGGASGGSGAASAPGQVPASDPGTAPPDQDGG